MVDVRNKRCEMKGCLKIPSYNFEGHSPKFCKDHKDDNMVNVVSKRCRAEGCLKQACYNYAGEKPKFCKNHKHVKMVNCVTNRCVMLGCFIIPSYNYEGEKPKFCKSHKADLMVYVLYNKRCAFEGCLTQPSYNFEGGKPKFCKTHNDLMVYVKTRKPLPTPVCTVCTPDDIPSVKRQRVVSVGHPDMPTFQEFLNLSPMQNNKHEILFFYQ